jgi:hypothetical protein
MESKSQVDTFLKLPSKPYFKLQSYKWQKLSCFYYYITILRILFTELKGSENAFRSEFLFKNFDFYVPKLTFSGAKLVFRGLKRVVGGGKRKFRSNQPNPMKPEPCSITLINIHFLWILVDVGFTHAKTQRSWKFSEFLTHCQTLFEQMQK